MMSIRFNEAEAKSVAERYAARGHRVYAETDGPPLTRTHWHLVFHDAVDGTGPLRAHSQRDVDSIMARGDARPDGVSHSAKRDDVIDWLRRSAIEDLRAKGTYNDRELRKMAKRWGIEPA